jgi:hypothetical protein
MFRIGETIYDNVLDKEVIFTEELRKGIASIDPYLAKTRWTEKKMEEVKVEEDEEEKKETKKKSKK